ncbi:hypothetical protein EDB83DRAFT_2325457 [Lactarius deliciosus]|nr:hypothetical protein EDB83DRAFT_2325457 [Lactarius deliciosus]
MKVVQRKGATHQEASVGLALRTFEAWMMVAPSQTPSSGVPVNHCLGGLAWLDHLYPTMAQSWTVLKNLKTCCRAISEFAVNSDGRLTGDPNVTMVLTPEQCPFRIRISQLSAGAPAGKWCQLDKLAS